MLNAEIAILAFGAVAVVATVWASHGRRRLVAAGCAVTMMAGSWALFRSARARAEATEAKVVKHCKEVAFGFPEDVKEAASFGLEGSQARLRRNLDVDHVEQELRLCLNDPSYDEVQTCGHAVRFAAYEATLDEFPVLMTAMKRAFERGDPAACPSMPVRVSPTPP